MLCGLQGAIAARKHVRVRFKYLAFFKHFSTSTLHFLKYFSTSKLLRPGSAQARYAPRAPRSAVASCPPRPAGPQHSYLYVYVCMYIYKV
jgi:hypothetical protein